MRIKEAYDVLRSMRERVERLGGAFEIESAPGKGTRLDAQIPGKKAVRSEVKVV